MDGLTARQEAYCAARARGLSQRAAYREAYPRARSWKDSSVDVRACELESSGKVMRRLREIREQARKELAWELVDAARLLLEVLYASMDEFRESAAEGVINDEARRAVLDAVASLNRLFGVDGQDGTEGRRVTILDDI